MRKNSVSLRGKVSIATRHQSLVIVGAGAALLLGLLLLAGVASAGHTLTATVDRDSIPENRETQAFTLSITSASTATPPPAAANTVTIVVPPGFELSTTAADFTAPTGWTANPFLQRVFFNNTGGGLSPGQTLQFTVLVKDAPDYAADAVLAWGLLANVTVSSGGVEQTTDTDVVDAPPTVTVRKMQVTSPTVTSSVSPLYADATDFTLSFTAAMPGSVSGGVKKITLNAPGGYTLAVIGNQPAAPQDWTIDSVTTSAIVWKTTVAGERITPAVSKTFSAKVGSAAATQDATNSFGFAYAYAFTPDAHADWDLAVNSANTIQKRVLEVVSFSMTAPAACSAACKATADQDNLNFRLVTKSHASTDITVTSAVTSSNGLDTVTATGSNPQTISSGQSRNYDFDFDLSSSTSDRTVSATGTATGASATATDVLVDIQTAPVIAAPASGRVVEVTSPDRYISSGTDATRTLNVKVNVRNTGEATASTLAQDITNAKILLDGIDDVAHNKRTSFTLDTAVCPTTLSGGTSDTCTFRVVLDSNHVPDQGAYTIVMPMTGRDANKGADDTTGALTATLKETVTVLIVDNTAPTITPPTLTPHPRSGEVDLRSANSDRYFINGTVTDPEDNLAGNPFVEITGPLPATTIFTTVPMTSTGSANEYTGTFSFTSTFGTFRYQVKAQDKAANVRANPTTASSTFTVESTTHTLLFRDNTPPVPSDITVSQAGVATGTVFQAGKALAFSVGIDDNFKVTSGNGVKLTVTGPGAPCASTERFMSLQGTSANGLGTYATEFSCVREGTYSFTITITDQANNGVATTVRTFTLEDTSGPSVTEARAVGVGDAATAITNPGFENPVPPATPTLAGWTASSGTAAFTADTTIMKRDRASARAIETSETSLGRLTQDVTAKLIVGTPHNLSGWIRTAGVSGSGGFVIELQYVDSTGAGVPFVDAGVTHSNGVVARLGPVTSTSDWTYYQTSAFVLPALPAGATKLVVALDFEDAKGTAWADDLAILPAGGRFHVKGESSLAFNVTVSDPIGVDKTRVFLQFINASDSSNHERPMAFDKELFDGSGLLNFTNVTNFAGFQELNYTLRVRALDSAGRESLVDFNSNEATIVFDRTLPTVSIIAVVTPSTFTMNCQDATLALAQANCRATAKVTAGDAKPFSVQINYTATLPDGTVFKAATEKQAAAAGESREFTFTDIVLIHNAQYSLQAHIEDLAGNIRLSNTRDILVSAYAPIFKEKFLSRTHATATTVTLDVVISNKGAFQDAFDLSVSTTEADGDAMPNRRIGGSAVADWIPAAGQIYDSTGATAITKTADVQAGGTVLIKFKATIPGTARLSDYVTFNLVATSDNQEYHSHNMTILVGLHHNRLEFYPSEACGIGATSLAACRETLWLEEAKQLGLNETSRVTVKPGETTVVNLTLVNVGTLNDTIRLDRNPITSFNTTTNAWTVSFASNHTSFVAGTPALLVLRPLESANVTVTIGAPGGQVNGAGANITLNVTSNSTTPVYNLTNVSAIIKFNSITFSALQLIKSATAYDGQNPLTIDFIGDLGTEGVFLTTKVNVTGPAVAASYDLTRSGGGAKTTGTYVATVQNWAGVGLFQWHIYATNSLGEADTSFPAKNFTIRETPNQQPAVTGATVQGATVGGSLTANVSFTPGGPIALVATVTDNFFVNAVHVDVFKGTERQVNASAAAPSTAKQSGSWSYNFLMPATAEAAFGNYTFTAYGFDANNNSAAGGPFNFTIGDFAGPVVGTPRLSTAAVNATGVPQVEVGVPLTITVEVTDNAGPENIDSVVANVTYPNGTSIHQPMTRLANATNATDNNYTVTLNFTTSGEHFYTIVATDKLGQTGGLQATRRFVVGTSLAPQVQIVSPTTISTSTAWKTGDDGKRWSAANATIELNAFDASVVASGVTMKVNGATVQATKTSITGGVNAKYSATFADGDNVTVELTAVDTTGASTIVTFQFRVDAASPAAPVESFENTFALAGEPAVAISPLTDVTLSTPADPGAGVKALSWRATKTGETAGAFQAYAGSFNVGTSGEDGVYLLEFYAEDLVGNRGATGNTSVYVDGTAPTLSHTPSGRIVNVTAEDTTTGIETISAIYTLNNTGLPKTLALTRIAGSNTYTGEFTDASIGGASVSYTLRATDGVGNVADLLNGTQPYFIGGTAKAPTVRITNPRNGATVNETTTITWTASHESGQPVDVVVTYERQNQAAVTLVSNQTGDGRVLWEVDQLQDGVYFIKVTGSLGALSFTAVNTVTLEKAGVVGPINLPESAVRAGSQIPITVPIFSKEKPVKSVEAVIKVDGRVVATVPMRDDGQGGDQRANDGIYTASYTPATSGAYTVDVVVNYDDGTKDTKTNAGTFEVAGGELIPPNLMGSVTTLGVVALLAVALAGYAAFVRWKQ